MKTGDTAAVFHCTFGALPEVHFLHSITISKLRKSRIQRFKPCMIWSWNEKDMAFGRQLHQAERKFRTMEIKVRNPQSTVRNFRTPQTNMRNWNSACENWIFLPTLFLLIFLCLNFHFLLVFNQPCNSLARKYPRKGKTTFLYKFSCNHWIYIFVGELSPGDQLL